jgi:hypothetical protein
MKTKYLKRALVVFGVFLAGAAVVWGAGLYKINTDTLRIGTSTNPADGVKIEFDDDGSSPYPTMRLGSSGSLEFSNDGTNFQEFGTGAGTVENLLSNPGCEAQDTGPSDPAGWTESAGTLSRTTAASEVAVGTAACKWDASGAAQTVESDAQTVSNLIKGRSCLARINYRFTGTAGDLTMKVVGATDLSLPLTLPVTGSDEFVAADIAFTCPSTGTVKIVISSTADASEIIWDEAHLGEDFRRGTVLDNAELMVRGYYPATTNCAWSKAEATYQDFNADADCPLMTVVHSTIGVDTPNDDLPNLTFTEDLPPGRYEVKASFMLSTGGTWTSDDTGVICITDDSNLQAQACAKVGVAISNEGHPIDLTYSFTTSSPVAKNFKLRSKVSDTINTTMQIVNAADNEVVWSVRKFSLKTARDTTNLETQGSLLQAHHENDCNAWPNTTSTSYADPGGTDSTCTFSVRQNKGFSGVESAAQTAGNYWPGILFTPPYPGLYNVCVATSLLQTLANEYATIRLFDTINSATLAETHQRGQAGLSTQHAVCGILDASSIQQYEVRLQAAVTSGAWNIGVVSTSVSNSVIEWQIYPMTQNFPQAVALTAPKSEVSCDGGNGHGGTDTKIRRFTNCTSVGTSISYVDSTVVGGTFTINKAGVYNISYSDSYSAGVTTFGISKGGSGATNVGSLSAADRLMLTANPAATEFANVNVSAVLSAGDVIRAHTTGLNDSGSNNVQFRVVQMTPEE